MCFIRSLSCGINNPGKNQMYHRQNEIRFRPSTAGMHASHVKAYYPTILNHILTSAPCKINRVSSTRRLVRWKKWKHDGISSPPRNRKVRRAAERENASTLWSPACWELLFTISAIKQMNSALAKKHLFENEYRRNRIKILKNWKYLKKNFSILSEQFQQVPVTNLFINNSTYFKRQ